VGGGWGGEGGGGGGGVGGGRGGEMRGHDTSVSEIDVNLHQKCASSGRRSHVGLPGEQAISSM